MRPDKTVCGIIDAQSVQNADTAGEKGYDADKKVSGIKRHINEECKKANTGNIPVLSIDAKKKENVGNFKNNGRT
jgi:hypothetical protein